MPYGVSGGTLERFVHESFFDLVRDILDAYGWFEEGQWYTPVTLNPKPEPKSKSPIRPNTAAVMLIDQTQVGWELGSNSGTMSWSAIFDLWAESREVGMHVRSDLLHALAGRAPEIGRDEPILSVMDSRMATPEVICIGYFEELEANTDPTPQTPWQENWFSVAGMIEIDLD